jgi:hypothetical protein
VDFRAGLALLPFFPMSPGDFALIFKGMKRGSYVQFDRGNITTLETFVHNNANDFSDMMPMMDELKSAEQIYRNSVPDLSHNRLRLFYDRDLWKTMMQSTVTSWNVRNLIDDAGENKFVKSKFLTLLFMVISIIPIVGKFFLKIFGSSSWRKHYSNIIKDSDYFRKAFKCKTLEKITINP